jgi:hypothetical protein
MAKISSYPIISTPTINDLLIGTDVDNLNNTKNFSIGDIASFIIGGSYVPYIGATANVNLGTFNITSGGFIVGGGTASQFLKANGTLDSTVYQPAGNYITQLSGEATGSGPGNATVTLSNAAVTGKLLTGLNITGSVITASDSILTAFGKVQNQINTLVGGVQYKGTWNAATNTPALVSSVGVAGNYYVVSVAGNTNLNGITDWQLGDWAIFNGSSWEKVDNTDAVISVNGQVGAVVLTTTNISEGTNLYYTDSRARSAINLTTTGNSGAATYNNTNGFFNIPEYTLAGLGGVPSTRQLTINGTAFDLSANRSWNVGTVTSVGTSGPLTGGTITGSGTIGITQSSTSTDGYLSSTDWTTFNNKQNTITNPVTGTGTAFFLPMWSSASSLVNSPLSYLSDTFTFQYNTPTGGTLSFTNSNGTAYTYTIQMNNFGSPRSTVHSYTDGIVVQSIGGVQVSRVFANGNTVFGTGVADNGHKLEITGDLYVSSIVNATTDTDRFLVSDAGVIKYRTGAELLSDIGAGVGSVTSVGLTMPSAFSVANSPITSSGTIAVTGAGIASQYIRGDGTLADFPTSTGGGSSVSYYLNGSVSQGTIGGVAYRELSETPIFGAGTDISIAADGYIASFITDAGDPALLNIPAGNWNFETYFSASSAGGTPSFYVELYRYDGTTFTLIASSVGVPELISLGTAIQPYFSTLAVPQTALAATDRLAVRYYVIHSGRTITLHTENGHLCQIVTTFSNGLTALNGLTAQIQYFQVGTSGTDFNIASASATHTFNLPTASATNRGALSSSDWTVFNGKQNALNGTGFVKISGTTISYDNSTYVTTNTTESISGFKTFTNTIALSNSISNGFGFEIGTTGAFTSLKAKTSGSANIVTLPSSNGTLALTTDLGAYLPLAGGTMTGAIVGTTSTFTNSGAGIGVGVTNSGSGDGVKITHSAGRAFNIQSSGAGFGVIINNETASTSAPFTIQKQGTTKVAFTDAGAADFSSSVTASSFVKLSGTSSQFLKADGSVDSSTYLTTGTAASTYLPLAGGTLTGALNGTSGTFTGTVSTPFISVSGSAGNIGNINSTNANGGYITWQTSGTTIADLGSAQQIFGAGGSDTFGINARGARSLILGTNDTARLTIASTGAATFSNNVSIYRNVAATATTLTIENATNNYNCQINFKSIYGGSTAKSFLVGSNINSGGGSWEVYDATESATRMIISSSGNVGIGTASPAQSLEVKGSSAGVIRLSSTSFAYNIFTSESDGAFYIRDVNNTSNRLTISSTGNVGIGTASPSAVLHVAKSDGANDIGAVIQQTANNTAAFLRIAANNDGGAAYNFITSNTNGGTEHWRISGEGASSTFAVRTGGTERMRITSGGDVLIGTQTNVGQRMRIDWAGGAGKWGIKMDASDGGAANLIEFLTGSTARGSITSNGTIVAYNVTSDYRLKEDLKEIKGLEKVQAIKVYDYKWKSEDSRMDGVLAHELAEVLPYAVTGEKDEINEDGTDKMQGVDYSKIVPVLIKAIQEQQEQIKSLTEQVEALKSQS